MRNSSPLLLDPGDYERVFGRNFYKDHIEPYLERENRRRDRLCAYCGKECARTTDHIIPRSLGGSDDDRNLVPCCHSCNSKKGARTPDEAGMAIRFLPEKHPLKDDHL